MRWADKNILIESYESCSGCTIFWTHIMHACNRERYWFVYFRNSHRQI